MLKFSVLLMSLLFIACQNIAYADVVSLSSNYVYGQTNMVDKLNDDRTLLTNAVNNVRGVYAGSAQSSGQIKARTVGEENMADDANPRIRTAENASCNDLVFTGLLPVITSSTLVGSIPSGVGYPDGYRIKKDSATAHTFTASKWTWIDLDINGSFTYLEQNISTTTPAISANSLRIARVSTDATELSHVQDLRVTSCTAGPFNAIADAPGEATLEDLFSKGRPARPSSPFGTTTGGYMRGLQVSWDSTTTFQVLEGAAYINGEYRILSSDSSIPSSAADPATNISGIDTGSLAATTRYYVYAVADQDSSDTLSIVFSTSASAPTGVTNYRFIGSIMTDGSSQFTENDITLAYSISDREIISAWINFNGKSTIAINDSYNVSGITDNGSTGNYTVTWDKDFNSTYYPMGQSCRLDDGASSFCGVAIYGTTAPTAGAVKILTQDDAGSDKDMIDVNLIAMGDTRT